MSKATKYVLFVGILIIALGALLLYARPDGQNSAGVSIRQEQGTLSADRAVHDFGTISMKNGNVSKTFTVANPTNEDIKISNLSSSCMCTNAYILNSDGSRKGPFGMPGHGGAATRANEIVKAGESIGIEVVYDPNAHGPAGVGMIDRFVYLEDENGNKLQFEIKANVTP